MTFSYVMDFLGFAGAALRALLPRRNGGRMEKKNLIAIVVVVVVVASFFLMKRRAHESGGSATQRPIVVDNVAILPQNSPKENAKERQKEQQELAKRREEYLKDVRQGVGFYPMQETQSGFKVVVRFEPFAVCHVGDLNAIFHDFRQTTANRVLITLEPLDGKRKALGAQVSLENLKLGFEKVFTLPASGTSDIMGIFICSDAKRTGRCAGKRPLDINGSFLAPGKKRPAYADKIYIFNLALITDKTIRFITEAPIPAMVLTQLKEQKQLQALGSEKSGKWLDYAQKLTESLRSYPVEVRGNALIIKMPYLNKAKCAK